MHMYSYFIHKYYAYGMNYGIREKESNQRWQNINNSM